MALLLREQDSFNYSTRPTSVGRESNTTEKMEIYTVQMLIDFFQPYALRNICDLQWSNLSIYNREILYFLRRLGLKNYQDYEDIISSSYYVCIKKIIEGKSINKSFIFTILHRKSIDFFRRSKVRHNHLVELDEIDEPSECENFLESVIFKQAFNLLVPSDQAILTLSYIFGMSDNEIIEALNNRVQLAIESIMMGNFVTAVNILTNSFTKITESSIMSKKGRARENLLTNLLTLGFDLTQLNVAHLVDRIEKAHECQLEKENNRLLKLQKIEEEKQRKQLEKKRKRKSVARFQKKLAQKGNEVADEFSLSAETSPQYDLA